MYGHVIYILQISEYKVTENTAIPYAEQPQNKAVSQEAHNFSFSHRSTVFDPQCIKHSKNMKHACMNTDNLTGHKYEYRAKLRLNLK
jgi:hypothetical protein